MDVGHLLFCSFYVLKGNSKTRHVDQSHTYGWNCAPFRVELRKLLRGETKSLQESKKIVFNSTCLGAQVFFKQNV